MTYLEAQEASVSGVAVYGNEVMQDIIWPKGSACPFGWVHNGYRSLDPEAFKNRDGWKPLHPPRNKSEVL